MGSISPIGSLLDLFYFQIDTKYLNQPPEASYSPQYTEY